MCSLRVRGVIQGGICDRHDFLQTNTSYQARYGYSRLQSFTSAYLQTHAVNDLASYPKPMHHERFTDETNDDNVNVQTS